MKSKLFLTSLTTIGGAYAILIIFLIVVFQVANIPLSYLVITSIIVTFAQFLIAPFIMDITMKWLYRVKFDVNMPDYLKNYIEEVCKNNKMKYPKIGYINDGAPNAFTYGRTKNDARIVLTQGIFDLLTPEEVKAVVSHEIGHAVHYDMFLMTAVQIIPLILYYIITKLGSSDDESPTAIIVFVSYILYIISEYVILGFSRTREYYADEFSVISTQNPNALASALVKIGYGLTTADSKEDFGEEKNNKKIKKERARKKARMASISALGIFDAKTSKSLVVTSYDDGEISKESIKKAARWELWNPWAKWYEFNSTHPMISKRIKAICKYCNTYNQKEFITFDEKQPESYVNNFALEVFLKFLPLFTAIAIIITGFIMFMLGIIIKPSTFIGAGLVIFSMSLFILLAKNYKNKDYKEVKIADLLSEVKVSKISPIPCIVKGQVIGRGTPGYILSEDFVIKDDTGIIFLDYNQPVSILNKIFALLKSKNYINQEVTVKGWYRRAPIPYIEIYTFTVGDKTKKCHTYTFTLVVELIILFIGGVTLLTSLLM